MSEVTYEAGQALFNALESHGARSELAESIKASDEIIRGWNLARSQVLTRESTPYAAQLLSACVMSAKARMSLISPASLQTLTNIGDEATTKWYAIVQVNMTNINLINDIRAANMEC